jgi:PIN domain nuclease of toxin-antitoxin system
LRLLLDTCTFLWLVAAPGNLSPATSAAIDRTDTELLLSDCSVWELCLKWRGGKIQLPRPPRLWVEEQVQIWRIQPLPIERTHLYRVTELPDHHRDPFDRLLVAQAIEEGLTVATPDPHFPPYPVAVLW